MQIPHLQVLFAVVACQLAVLASCANNETATASDSVESIFNSVEGAHLGGNILAMAGIAGGIVILVLGYRVFRFTLFMVGFAFGGTSVAIVVERLCTTDEWVVTASWVAFVVGGMLCGFLVLFLATLGIFTVGAVAGVVLAMVLNDALGYMIYPSNPSVILALLCVVLGVVGGMLALKLEKPVLVIATSLFGAGIVVWGIGFYAGDFPTFSDLKQIATQDTSGKWKYSIPGAWCAYLAGFTVLFVLGLGIQFQITSRGDQYHRHHARHSRDPYVRA